MAKVTYVPQGKSSTQAESAEMDYTRDERPEDIELRGVHLDAKDGGWAVTILHDRNGRSMKQMEHFGSYEEAHAYCAPDKEEQSGEPLKQKGGASPGRGGY